MMIMVSSWRKARGWATVAVAFATLIAGVLAHADTARANADPDAARLVAAAGLINTGKLADAAKILEDLRRRDPANAQVLRLLGRAYLRNKQFDQALAVMQEILAKQPDAPQELYGVGVIHAARNETDAAFAWLGKAKATHRIDMTMIQADPNLAGLHDDPRFAVLLPKPEDFENPFVENVKIIREWDGESANDQFGWIARSLGDVDGDGVADFVTSAPTRNAGGEQAGRVYVYSTRTGKLLWTADGRSGDQLGTGLESAGDVDGDGVQDVIASAIGSDTAYVYSGKDGHVLLTLHGEAKGDNFGNHASTAGDIDRDGYADVIVGAPANKAGGEGAGRAYVYSGKDGHVLLTLTGEHAGDQFGSAVTGYTDAKHTFLVVGAPTAGARKTGRVYVYDKLTDKPKFTFDSDSTGNLLGYMFLAVPGDVDGDGVPDIYASDWSNAAKGPATGRVYVYSGRTGKVLLTLTGETAGEGFGTTHATAGDVNHDGHADLIVGSWQYAGAAISGGRAYLYSGRDGKLLRTYTNRIPGDTFGFDAVAIGDADGDGITDLLITSAWSAIHGFHSGRVFVISSGVGGKAPR
ncbi:MAG TPA: FG-GAP-like repeat-containing protein [Rudaea sp.]|nr:FG-GAP-like repeat-containing protein [Rudaea sp.]